MLKKSREEILSEVLKNITSGSELTSTINHFDPYANPVTSDIPIVFGEIPDKIISGLNSTQLKPSYYQYKIPNVELPPESIGWPPMLVDLIYRVALITADTLLKNIYTTQETDDEVDNILRGSTSTV